MCKNCFVHLHNHSALGSIRDSTAKFPEIVERCKDLGYKSFALTDHGMMSGIIPFYEECLKGNLKPILGVEAYYCDDISDKNSGYCHLLLLAKNIKGYRSLMKATSLAYTDGYYKKTMRGSIIGRMDWNMVNNLEDVIVTSACVGGLVNSGFLNSKYTEKEEGDRRAKQFHDRFKDDFYIELQMHKEKEDKMFSNCNEYSLELSKKYGIGTVFTNDCHFVKKEDMDVHRAWIAVGIKKASNQIDYVYDDSFYIKTPEEIAEICPLKEAMDNTVAIDEKIDWIDLNINRDEETKEISGISYLPSFEGLTAEEANDKLIELTRKGLLQTGKAGDEESVSRAIEELEFMTANDFGAYFLPIWDAIKYAEESCIPVGPGRGSAGGSLVINMLGITKINPLDYGLKFSRFLNPGRCHKRKVWEVEDESGEIVDIVEGFTYHMKDKNNNWTTKKGEEIIREFQENI